MTYKDRVEAFRPDLKCDCCGMPVDVLTIIERPGGDYGLCNRCLKAAEKLHFETERMVRELNGMKRMLTNVYNAIKDRPECRSCTDAIRPYVKIPKQKPRNVVKFRIVFECVDVDAKCSGCGNMKPSCTLVRHGDKGPLKGFCPSCLEKLEVSRTDQDIDLDVQFPEGIV